MDVLCAELELHLSQCASLKHKRVIVNGLKERLREQFGVSVAELEYQDRWQRTLLGVALVCGDRRRGEAVFGRMREFLYRDPRVNVLRFDPEWR